jgi:plastocyanin
MSARRLLVTLACVVPLVAAAPAAAAERTFTLHAGPFTMAGFNTQFLSVKVPTPGIRGFVTYMHARLVDARGRQVTIRSGMLHHVYFNNLDRLRVKGQCTARLPEVFYSTGEENESLDLPPGYGYRLLAGDRWRMTAMLMSHRMAAKRVWVEYTVRVSTDRLTGVRPLWVRANGCGHASSYGVPGDGGPGSVDDRVYHWSVPMSGRIVAGGGHLHAGAIGLQLRQPSCGDRVIYDNVPRFAPANALVYTATPMLHEAGPVNTTWWRSATGVPVHKGDVLDLHGMYENDHARGAVMAITHVYLAPDKTAVSNCDPLPADVQTSRVPPGTRAHAPYQPIPLWKLDDAGRPVQLGEPEAPPIAVADGAAIGLRTAGFNPENVVVHQGATLRWTFLDNALHNLTFASGPRVVGGDMGTQGDVVSTTFTEPGRYQLFCYLHPMTMHEQVTVLPPG